MQQIYFTDMELHVKIKSLSPEEVESFVDKYSECSKVQYMMEVLNACIYNLNTEIKTAVNIMKRDDGDQFLREMYNGCVMINPGLDIQTWVKLTQLYDIFSDSKNGYSMRELESSNMMPSIDEPEYIEQRRQPSKPRTNPKISKAKFLNLKNHLQNKVIGQSEAIDEIFNALKRSQVGLNDQDRPLGVFLFAGPSGVGKTLIAKELHKYLFNDRSEMVRIDCGEFQQKHENQKLIGSASGYVGYEDGGQLTDAIRENPQTVLLLDEVEKAHPDLWGTFLNVFDDGYLTDNKGTRVSFKDVIIIMTSNLGNDKISEETYSKGTGFHASIESSFNSTKIPKRKLIEDKTNEAIRKYFKPELLNRLDEIIIFNYLQDNDYNKIAELEFTNLAEKLSKLGYNLNWSQEAVGLLANEGRKSIEGARSLARTRRKKLEDPLAQILIETKHKRGTTFNIVVENEKFDITNQ